MSLSKILSEKNLVGLEVISGKYVDKIDKTGFTSSSFPLSVAGIGCHGKFLYIIFKNKSSLWFTMGISGSLSETRSEHSRIRFYFEDTDIFFSDKNNIGTVIKHIPGHGLAKVDSHKSTPIVNKNLSYLVNNDFSTFKNKKSFFAMTAHIIYNKIDTSNFFVQDDIFSHLNLKTNINFFYPTILKKIIQK